MYCKRCGAPTGSDAVLCYDCARAQGPVRRKPKKGFLHTVKGYMHLIILVMSVVALVFGLLNLFSAFKVVGIVTNGEVRETEYITVKEMEEPLKLMDKSFGAGYAGNILFGLLTLAAAFGKPLLLYARRSSAAKAYRKIANRIQGFHDPITLR